MYRSKDNLRYRPIWGLCVGLDRGSYVLPHERTDNNPFYGKTNVVVRQHVLNDETKLLQAFVVYYQLPPIEDGEEDTITELTDIFEC